MANQLTEKNETIVMENTVNLKQFPPLLRKLGKYLLKSEYPMTVAAACDELNLNKSSVYSSICRAARQGNDFNAFVDQVSKSILHANKIAVYDRLVERAVSDASTSHNDRKMFLQLSGDLSDDLRVNVNILSIGINTGGGRPNDMSEGKGVVDVNPVVPQDDG